MIKIVSVALFLLSFSISAKAQYSSLNAHSHNDYDHSSPFYGVYLNHFGSIEADVWAIDGNLFVAHHRSEIKPEKIIDSLYIHPIVKTFRQNGNKAWHNSPSAYQLLIDIKTDVEPALTLLIEKLKKFPDVFDPSVNANAIRVVISGNRPAPSGFKNYPQFIFFDGKLNTKYDGRQLERIALFSENMKKFTIWNGRGPIPEKEETRLKQVIDSVHHINKKS
ncbi:MAG: hypothetical protein RBS73_15550 [Prolixibacteraceae bacterium]|jgi:alkaline phosphatase|nr:hypothetical protein [Prolixibacteraceae bacterium]